MNRTVLVDVDGVLADQIEHTLDMAEQIGIDHTAVPSDIDTWTASVPGYDGEIGDLISEILDEAAQEYFLSMPKRTGARKTLRELQADGWTVVICTHRPRKHHQYTNRWLEKHGIPFDAYAFDVPENKGRITGDVLIDDYQGNVRRAAENGTYGILMNRNYSDNHVIEAQQGTTIASDWADVRRLLGCRCCDSTRICTQAQA